MANPDWVFELKHDGFRALPFPLDKIFLLGYIPSVEWEVELTSEFNSRWDDLNADEQEDVDALVRVLQEKGPNLRRPYTDVIETSKYPNMKELIIQHKGRPYRVLYIFDPRRSAILLLGGDKTGNDRWYEENVPKADKIYGDYLDEIRKEGLI